MINIEKEKISVKGEAKIILAEYATIVAHLRKEFEEEEIMKATAIGLSTYDFMNSI